MLIEIFFITLSRKKMRPPFILFLVQPADAKKDLRGSPLTTVEDVKKERKEEGRPTCGAKGYRGGGLCVKKPPLSPLDQRLEMEPGPDEQRRKRI